MKKLITGLLTLLCLFCFVACKDTNVNDGSGNGTGGENTPVKELTSIVLDETNVQKSFYLGDEFNSNGLKVVANYSDNTTIDLTKDCVIDSSDFNNEYVGVYTIDVYYQTDAMFKRLSYEVEVKEIIPELTVKYVVGLDLVSPEKTEYNATEKLDLTGMVVKAVYSDNSTKELTNTEYTLSEVDMNTPNEHAEVVVSYSETYTLGEREQKLTVKNSIVIKISDVLQGIEVNPNGLTEATQYEEIDISGWTITGKYLSGIDREIDNSLVTIEYDKNQVGQQNLVVSYTENNITKTAQVTINVNESTSTVSEKLFFTADDLAVGSYTANTTWTDSLGTSSIITIVAASDGKVDVDGNNKTADDGTTFTQRLKLGGSAKDNARHVVLDLASYAGKQVTITVYCLSSSSTADRKLGVWLNEYVKDQEIATYEAPGSGVKSQSLVVDGGSTYVLGSLSGGVNIYGIRISVAS